MILYNLGGTSKNLFSLGTSNGVSISNQGGTISASNHGGTSQPITLQGNTFNSASQLVLLDSSTRLPAVDGSQLTNITSSQVGAVDISVLTDTEQFTGFCNPENVIMNYDPVARTMILTGVVKAYYQGHLVTALTSGWVSPAHPSGQTTNQYLIYDGTSFYWASTFPDFRNLFIAFAIYINNGFFGQRECHGWQGYQNHKELHYTIGTWAYSPVSLSNYEIEDTTQRSPYINAVTIYDEDLETINPALTTSSYTIMSLTGSDAKVNFTLNSPTILPVSGNQPYHNTLVSGSWTQTLMMANNYQSVWLFAVPVTSDSTSQEYRYIWIQGQVQSDTLSVIQAENTFNLNTGSLTEDFPEIIFLAKFIVKYTGSDWFIQEVDILSGSKFAQTTPVGNYLITTATDQTLTGNGTVDNPLSVVTATSTTKGIIQPDNSTLVVNNGTLSVGVTYLTPTGNGSGLTNLNANNITTGTLSNLRLPSDVTTQGNTFNGINELVQLNGSGYYPALNGSLITNLNASNITSGTIGTSYLPQSIVGGINYQGVWNASTNTPTLTSGVGVNRYLYIVDVAGTTTLDGNSVWNIGDWALFNGTIWTRIPSNQNVISVNGYQGVVVLSKSDIGLSNVANVDTTNASNITTGTLGSARLPIASTTLTGGVKIDNTSVVINNGIISVGTISALSLPSSVTQEGNLFNGANQLVVLNSSAQLPAVDGSLLIDLTKSQVGLSNVKNVDTTNASNITTGTLANTQLSSSVTLQGNTFNGVSELVQLNGSGYYPALNGSLITNLSASNINSGTLSASQLPSTVTTQSNTFNGASQLVQLNASTQLPAVSGVNLTNLNASNVNSGTLSISVIPALNYQTPLTAGTNISITSGTISNTYTLPLASSSVLGGVIVDNSTILSSSGTISVGSISASKLTGTVSNSNLPAYQTPLTAGSGISISSGTISNTYSYTLPATVTTQSNTFNGASQLVQLNSSTQLPSVSGVNLTNLNASNINSGTVSYSYLPTATTSSLGIVITDNNTLLNSSGTISVGSISASKLTGTVSNSNLPAYQTPLTAGTNISISNGTISNTYSLPIASSTVLGGVKVDGTSIIISSGTISSTYSSTLPATVTTQSNTFNGANQLVQLNSSTQLPAVSGALLTNLPSNINDSITSSTTTWSSTKISSTTLSASQLPATVTTQSNTFNGASQLVQLDANTRYPSASGVNITNLNANNISSGQIGTSYLPATVTTQSNTFNGANQLVQLNSSTQLPAVSGVNLTNLNASSINSGTIGSSYLPSTVTTQSNTFNGASQLVQLNSNTQLPTCSGVNLTNLNGSNIASGTVGVSYLPVATTSTNGIVGIDNATIVIKSGTISVGSISGTAITSGTISSARLPIATTTSLGVVQPDGTSITISNGTISTSSSFNNTKYYADMYATATVNTVTIGTTGTFATVSTGMSNSLTSGFTYSSSALTCTVAGIYKISWNMCVDCNSSQGIIVGILHNGTIASNGQNATYVQGDTSGFFSPLSGSLLITLAVNDTIKFGITNATSTHSVIVKYASLTINN